MTEPPTPAQDGDLPLKRETVAFDSCRAMRTTELKLSIQRADYVIDPVAVAEAMLRHALSHRRWWNPIALRVMPPADSVTSGWPAIADPTQVNGAARSAARRPSGPTHTQSS
jgi:hypothetical protein